LLLSCSGLKNMVNKVLTNFDGLSATMLKQRVEDWQTEIALEILQKLFRYRRLRSTAGACAENPCGQCLSLHLEKVRRFVKANEPVHFVLPAFPAKSPNTQKVLGRLPDMAEELALKFLQNVCDEIEKIYQHGARITICSDGRVFSDIVRVPDEDITEYGQALKEMLNGIDKCSLDTFGMETFYEMNDYNKMREHLLATYADSIEKIERRVETDEQTLALFNGIHRFLFEDSIAFENQKSRTQVRNECKEFAYKLIRRSDAFSKLINDCFPNSLRLSIHPQGPHTAKIGILLGETDDRWLTPWHSVAVKQDGGFKFMRRHEAESLGARLIEREGRASHYEI